MDKKGEKKVLENIVYIVTLGTILTTIFFDSQLFLYISLLLLFVVSVMNKFNIEDNLRLIKRVIVVAANHFKITVKSIERDVVTTKRPYRRRR